MPGLKAPEEAKEISVPPHERVGLHNRQERAPMDESRQEDECNARRIVRPSWSDLALDITRELLPQEEVLGRQLHSRPDHQPQRANRSTSRAIAVRSTCGDVEGDEDV